MLILQNVLSNSPCNSVRILQCPFCLARPIAIGIQVHTSFLCCKSHATTDVQPFTAAYSRACMVQPSERWVCKNVTIFKWPLDAASFIAFKEEQAPHSGNWEWRHLTTWSWPCLAASEIDAKLGSEWISLFMRARWPICKAICIKASRLTLASTRKSVIRV